MEQRRQQPGEDVNTYAAALQELYRRVEDNVFNYPEAIKENLAQALVNCDVITQQIKDLLDKLRAGRLGRRIQWASSSRDDMAKLRSSLEAHKSSIEIALTVGSIQMLCQVKRNQHAISRAELT